MARGKIIGGLGDDTRIRFDLLKTVYRSMTIKQSVSTDEFINYILTLFECVDGFLREVMSLYRDDDTFKTRLYDFVKEYKDSQNNV